MAKKRRQGPSGPSPEQIDKTLSNERLRLIIFGTLATFLGASVFVLAMTPLAKAIAGTTTNFSLNVSLAVNVGLGIATATSGAGCVYLNQRRRHHYRRARELEDKVARLSGKSV